MILPQREMPTDDGRASAIDRPPLALTDSHIAALTAAVHRAGFTILHDPETGNIELVRDLARHGTEEIS